MKKLTLIKSIAVVMLLLSSQLLFSQPKKTSGYAPVNGLKIYYEIYGEGKPLLLLHGAYMTIDMNWAQLLPELSKTRKVIALEMQGHGRTADIERPFSFEGMADDVAQVMRYLKIDTADVIGYSLGGTIALELAIQKPSLVNKMVIISSAYKSEGWLPQIRSMFQTFKPEFFDSTPLKPAYESVAPDPKYWRSFVTKMIEFDKKEYNLGEEKIKAIKVPVLLIMGDNDGIDMAHKASFYKMLGGDVSGDMAGLPKSQLAILPGSTHVSLMMKTDAILSLLKPFLNL
jgi:pimeloyl-ACP methyl ester carboxylesterase